MDGGRVNRPRVRGYGGILSRVQPTLQQRDVAESRVDRLLLAQGDSLAANPVAEADSAAGGMVAGYSHGDVVATLTSRNDQVGAVMTLPESDDLGSAI